MKKLALIFVAGCAVVRPMVASNDNLADHRAFVLARAEGDRLAHAQRYLESHPRGAWAADVRAAFDVEEAAYYRNSTRSRDAAIDYIAWLPRGPHVAAAYALVRSFDEHEPEDEASRMVSAARASEERFERAAAERQAATDAVLVPLRLVVDPDVYGRPLADSHELSSWLLAARNFGATPTRRTRSVTFTLPSRDATLPRTLEITVEIEQRGDVVSGVVVSGPDLFARTAAANLLREPTAAEAETYVRDLVMTLVRARAASVHVEFAAGAMHFTRE